MAYSSRTPNFTPNAAILLFISLNSSVIFANTFTRFSHSSFPYPAVFVGVGCDLCSVYVHMIHIYVFLFKYVSIDVSEYLFYFPLSTLFIKLSIVIWLGGGSSCNNHIKRISVLHSFSIFLMIHSHFHECEQYYF